MEVHNPEDMTIYRENGTVFFDSVVYAGVCRLYRRIGEKVRHIV